MTYNIGVSFQRHKNNPFIGKRFSINEKWTFFRLYMQIQPRKKSSPPWWNVKSGKNNAKCAHKSGIDASMHGYCINRNCEARNYSSDGELGKRTSTATCVLRICQRRIFNILLALERIAHHQSRVITLNVMAEREKTKTSQHFYRHTNRQTRQFTLEQA